HVMSVTDDLRLVRRAVMEVINEGRLEPADELFAPDFVNHGGLIPDVITGPESVRISVAVLRRAFPRLWLTIDMLEVQGDRLVLSWTARNRPPGSAQAPDDPAGADRLTGTTRVRCAEGKIAETWTE